MALVSVGAAATGLGLLWQYWRVPYRLWQWHKAPEVEPAVGQLWRAASLGGPNSDMKVTVVTEEHIETISTTDKDGLGDYLELALTWKAWERMAKARRLYCVDTNESIEDQYFGSSSED